MPLTDNLILNLVKLGFIGFAALIFVMTFIILLRNQNATPENAELRKRFLTLGVAVIVVAAVVQVLSMFLGDKPAAITFNFSPSFEANDLPTPTLQMADQALVKNTKYTIAGERVVVIGVDDVLKKVRSLDATSKTLADLSNNLANDLKLPPTTRVWTPDKARILSQYTTELQGSLRVNDLAKVRELNGKIAAMQEQ